MPTYGYRCENGHEFEVHQSMSEPPLEKCQECGAPVRRIFYPVGIVFKGPGFYKTDSRGSSSSTTAAGPANDSKPDTEKPEQTKETSDSSGKKPDSSSKPEKKAERKPPPKPETKPAPGGSGKKPGGVDR